MAVLLMGRWSGLPFHEWLADLNDEIVLFTTDDMPHPEFYHKLVRIQSFDTADVLWNALDQHRETPFTAVFGTSEYDVIRMGHLRDAIGVQGQSLASAIAYRDKVVMKEHAVKAGMEVAKFHRIETSLDLRQFVEQHGYPVVIKPVDGGGAVNTQVIHDESQMLEFLKTGPLVNMMVETFVEGDMYHVDGIYKDGELLFGSVSRYLNGCLAWQQGLSRGSLTLDPDSPLFARMREKAIETIRALPETPLISFHAEFFLTPDDRILLCEIASRSGGARVVDTIQHVYGLHQNRTWTRLACGLNDKVVQPVPAELGGYLVVPSRPGVVRALPAEIPFDWVVDYTPGVKPGVQLDKPTNTVANLATFIVKGPTEEIVEARLMQLNDWFLSAVEWEEEVEQSKV